MNKSLFNQGSLSQALATTARQMAERLQDWNQDDLLKAPETDIVDQLVEDSSVRCPTLLRDDAWMPGPSEVVHRYKDYFGDMLRQRVTRLVLVVPFDGEKVVFTLRANTWSPSLPQVLDLNDHELRIAIDGPPNDPAAVRASFDEQLAKIETFLAWSNEEINHHNEKIRADAPILVRKRREQLLTTRNLQAQIGYPIRRRPDADTYSIPMKRRALRPNRPQQTSTGEPFKPEPAMSDSDYRAALAVLRNARNALERTPSLAETLDEENIRDLLLINLNATFEGDAAGEVFNGEGKTDILIRANDRNIFIGECKIWNGPKTMGDALKQIFKYLVWRDTKAAILLFIRNKNITAIIDKAIEKIETHPNYKRREPSHHEEELNFTMHAQDDPAREIHLALIPFALRSSTAF